MNCPSCGATNDSSVRFCVTCGTSMAAAAPETSAEASPPAASPPPVAGSVTTKPPGLLLGLIGWLFSDMRRLGAAAGVVAVVLGAGWFINNRPASRDDICTQAQAFRAHLNQPNTEVFDNEFFDMAANLGKAASHPDGSAGGDVAAVQAAGARLSAVGGKTNASAYEVEGPLQTIESWCAAGPAVVAAGSAPDPGTQLVDPSTQPAYTASAGAAPGQAYDCEAITPYVKQTLPKLQLSTEASWQGDVPAGMNAYSFCAYGFPPQPGGSADLEIQRASSPARTRPGSGCSRPSITFPTPPDRGSRPR